MQYCQYFRKSHIITDIQLPDINFVKSVKSIAVQEIYHSSCVKFNYTVNRNFRTISKFMVIPDLTVLSSTHEIITGIFHLFSQNLLSFRKYSRFSYFGKKDKR